MAFVFNITISNYSQFEANSQILQNLMMNALSTFNLHAIVMLTETTMCLLVVGNMQIGRLILISDRISMESVFQ